MSETAAACATKPESDAVRASWGGIWHAHDNVRLIEWLARRGWVSALPPERRRLLLGAGALVAGLLYVLAEHAPWSAYRNIDALWMPLGVYALLLIFIVALYAAAVRFRELPEFVQRHPQVALHAVFWLLLL